MSPLLSELLIGDKIVIDRASGPGGSNKTIFIWDTKTGVNGVSYISVSTSAVQAEPGCQHCGASRVRLR
jgi:hypothetical protein